tara:strand:- start:173 stop:604 length:432 start_codon:yes stop_codon:yes gene_type:complete
MSYQKVLVGEISSVIDQLMADKIVIDPRSVASIVCGYHDDELMEEAPFSTHNNYKNVRREVRSVMSRKLVVSEDNFDSQLTIEGTKYVQKYYSINRDGEQLGVPVDDLTKEEVKSKADHLRKMGRACLRHARELEEYTNLNNN